MRRHGVVGNGIGAEEKVQHLGYNLVTQPQLLSLGSHDNLKINTTCAIDMCIDMCIETRFLCLFARDDLKV